MEKKIFDEISVLLNNEKYSECLDKLDNEMKKFENRFIYNNLINKKADILSLYGEILIKQKKQYKEGYDLFDQALHITQDTNYENREKLEKKTLEMEEYLREIINEENKKEDPKYFEPFIEGTKLYEQGEFSNALQYFEKSEKIVNEEKNIYEDNYNEIIKKICFMKCKCLNNIALKFVKQQKFIESIKYLNQSLENCSKDNQQMYNDIKENIEWTKLRAIREEGENLIKKNKFEDGIKKIEEAIKKAENYGEKEKDLVKDLINIKSVAYFKYGQEFEKKNDINKAKEFYEKAINNSTKDFPFNDEFQKNLERIKNNNNNS